MRFYSSQYVNIFTVMRPVIEVACICLMLTLIFKPARASGVEISGSGTLTAPYVISETKSPIRIDGVLDEQTWEKALVLELNYEVDPGENTPAPVRTEVLLIHNRSQLFAAFRCYDPHPSAIRAHLSDRDHLGNDDWVGIILDTFNDGRRSFNLLVNPLGVQEDMVETESGGSNWDAIWESAGQITEWGYLVEIAIPLNQLRFQKTELPQIWGLDAVRNYPRSQNHRIGLFARDRSNNCYLCQATKIIGFKDASPGYNLEISPAITSGRSDQRVSMPSGSFANGETENDLGVTAKWGITPSMILSGTLNPDFSQVEADALQMDINQPFALYFSERRPFFTEGSDFFGTLKNAIYTRTMHQPSWGIKLSGKEAGNTIGTYIVQDRVTNLIFPGSQGSQSTSLDMASTAAVVRYKRDIGEKYTLGALITDREGKDYYNRLSGLDADLRVTRTDQIQLQLLGSCTNYPSEIVEDYGQSRHELKDYFLAFEYDHSARTHYWWLDYDQVGSDFRADLGFIPMVGFRNVEGGYSYTWISKPGQWWAQFRSGWGLSYYEDEDGNLLNKGGQWWVNYQGAFQSWFSFAANNYQESYEDRVFTLLNYSISGGLQPWADLRVSINTNIGDRLDYDNSRKGKRIRINPEVEYDFGRHLQLSLDHTFEYLRVTDGRLYTANLSQLSVVYHLNNRTFFRAILQYRLYDYDPKLYIEEQEPENQYLFNQLLFSYKINPLTVLFLGYSSNYDGNREFNLSQRNRSFLVKLGYALSQ